MHEQRPIATQPLAVEAAPGLASRTEAARWSLPLSFALHAGMIGLVTGFHAPPDPPPAVVSVELSFVAAAAEPASPAEPVAESTVGADTGAHSEPAPEPAVAPAQPSDTRNTEPEMPPDVARPPVAEPQAEKSPAEEPPIDESPVAEVSMPVLAEPANVETRPPVQPPVPARRPPHSPLRRDPSPTRPTPAAVPPAGRAGATEEQTAPTPAVPAVQTTAPAAPSPDAPLKSDRQAADYFGAIQARLARHKVYPPAARQRRQEGVVLVRFTIVADGTITGWAVVEGSGHAILDQAAEEMIRRASPLPPIPAEMGRTRIDITLPVRFALQ
ncbi:protein [Azospirillum sp. B510]|nr:protein [Azospirillum sp. B510]